MKNHHRIIKNNTMTWALHRPGWSWWSSWSLLLCLGQRKAWQKWFEMTLWLKCWLKCCLSIWHNLTLSRSARMLLETHHPSSFRVSFSDFLAQMSIFIIFPKLWGFSFDDTSLGPSRNLCHHLCSHPSPSLRAPCRCPATWRKTLKGFSLCVCVSPNVWTPPKLLATWLAPVQCSPPTIWIMFIPAKWGFDLSQSICQIEQINTTQCRRRLKATAVLRFFAHCSLLQMSDLRCFKRLAATSCFSANWGSNPQMSWKVMESHGKSWKVMASPRESQGFILGSPPGTALILILRWSLRFLDRASRGKQQQQAIATAEVSGLHVLGMHSHTWHEQIWRGVGTGGTSGKPT